MKFNLNNPAFLQMAGNRSLLEQITMRFDRENPIVLFPNGTNCVATYLEDGVEKSMQITSSSVVIPADLNTDIIFKGVISGITAIGKDGEFAGLSALSFSKCNSFVLFDTNIDDTLPLTRLDFRGAPNLYTFDGASSCLRNVTYLDISECVLLTTAYIVRNITHLTEIRAIAIHSQLSNDIAAAITNANSVDGVVYLRRGDEFNQTIIDAAMEKGWDVQYYS